MNAPKFKIKSHVTVPLLKVDDGKTYYVKFLKAIHRAIVNEAEQKRYDLAKSRYDALSAEEKATAEVPQAPNPPMLSQVVNLENGEIHQIIIGSVLQSELEREYPDAGYVGKGFQIMKSKIQGKRYAAYQIAELELDEEPADKSTTSQVAEESAKGKNKQKETA